MFRLGAIGRLRKVWQWVKSGLVRGLPRQEAQEQYVGGGGEIEDYEWDQSWAEGERLYWSGAAITEFPLDVVIPRGYFVPKRIDYAGKYHMSATVGYWDKELGAWTEKFVSANADDLLSREDWEWEMILALMRTEQSPQIDWGKGVTFWDYLPEERA